MDEDRSQLALQRRRWPTRSTRSRSSTRSTCRRSWPASGRTSRPAATAPIWSEHFTGTNQKWFTFTNGAHIDSLDPVHVQPLVRLPGAVRRAPGADRRTRRSSAPPRRSSTRRRWGSRRPTSVTLPADPIQLQPTYAVGARRRSKQLPAGPGAVRQRRRARRRPAARRAGDPYPGFEQSFSTFPVPGTTARTWYLGPGGTLDEQPPTARRASTRTPRTRTPLPLTDYGSQHRHRRAVGQRVAVAVELAAEPGGHRGLLRLGAAHGEHHGRSAAARVNLWVRSSTPDVDLQATISEVRPDGNETFVQNGWIRASERKLVDRLEQHVQADEHAARADPDASPRPT